MKSMRTIGILLIHGAVMASACSSDKNPAAGSSASSNTGGSSNVLSTAGNTAISTNTTSSGGSTSPLNTGGNTAISTNATSSGGSTNLLNTGGSDTAPQDAGNSDAAPDGSVPVAAPSIVGVYTDGYFEHRITVDTWFIDTSIFHITIVNNSADFLIALADSRNQYSASLWNRFDWNIDDSHVLRYCETTYNAPTEQAALDTPAANAQDFVNGCSGFSWSVLTPIDIGDAGADAGH